MLQESVTFCPFIRLIYRPTYKGGDLAIMKHIDEAFDEIYKKYAKMLYGYILQLCKDPVTADDILQTTFLKAIEHADSFEGKCEVSTWLCRIAKNTWLDMCKQAERKNISLEQAPEQQGEMDILQNLVEQEQSVQLHKQVHILQEPYKEVFMLRVMGCLSFKQIGEIFGKSENWGRVTFYRAKEKLKKQIGDD